MESLMSLADPSYVAKFQRLCGVEIIKPGTCDQQTQTKAHHFCNGISSGTSNGSSSPRRRNVGASTNGNHSTSSCNGDSVAHLNRSKKNGKASECNNNNGNSSISSSSHNGSQRVGGSNSHQNGDAPSCNGASSNHVTHSDMETRPVSNSNPKTGGDDPKACSNTPKTKPCYRVKYKSLKYLAYFGAFLGNEEFYLTFFPFCVWNLDSLIVRHISLLWCLVMYLGQAAKDYLCWPRPNCPPVVRLETSYLQEFSMPSTHAMAATAIPIYMAQLVVERYQVPVPVAAAVALFWFVTTCYSRLYLGVHTILDLIAGIIFSLILYATFTRYIEFYDLYQQTHKFAPVMVMVTAFMLSTVCYPSQHKVSSKGDAVQIVASVAGFSIGFWLHYQLGYTHMPSSVMKPYPVSFPSMCELGFIILRFVSGTAVVVIIHEVLKPNSIRFFSYLYGLEFPDKSNSSVVTGYKFTTFFSLGFAIAFFIPLMHGWMGIARMSFYDEVL